MKKLILILLIILSFFFAACEDSFSPKGELQEKYALTCVIRGDTALQIASIYGSYDVEGFDPSVNDQNSAYRNADVRLWYQDTVYVFKDSTVQNPSNPDSLFHFYYLNNFKPTGKGELLEIEATLTNGKRLKASCFTPARFSYNTQETSNTIPAVNTSTVNVVWISEDDNNFYVGRIRVKYFENVNGSVVEKYISLPSRLVVDGDEVIPIYPTPSRAQNIAFAQAAISEAFLRLGEDVENKQNITVSNKAVIEILSIDENLSRYYSASLEDNSYTVRVNEMDYSNVEGGFGLFGALQKENKNITIQPEYIQSFGYKVLFEN